MPGSMSHKLSSLLSGQGQWRAAWAIMGEFNTVRSNGQLYLKITSKILNIFSVISLHRPNKNRIGWI